ncbi:MAG: PTS IIA-like nitrogen regulatory protein PtsN [Gammaproteobacteria bacterium]|jgi:PTS system nitrogen regulatory IIA component
MQISELLTPERVVCNVDARSKKRALEILSELLARDDTDIAPVEAFNCMIGRERLGSTGIGKGVALPHGRLPGLTASIGAFIRLREPVDYDGGDAGPVDLLFALLVPQVSTDDHLQTLAALAEQFNDETFCRALRECHNSMGLFTVLTRPPRDRRATG